MEGRKECSIRVCTVPNIDPLLFSSPLLQSHALSSSLVSCSNSYSLYLLLALSYFFFNRLLFLPAPPHYPSPTPLILSLSHCTLTRITSPCLYLIFRSHEERNNILARGRSFLIGERMFLLGKECAY